MKIPGDLLVVACLVSLSLPLSAQAPETYKGRLAPVPVDAQLVPNTLGHGSASVALAGPQLTVSRNFCGVRGPAPPAQFTGAQGSAGRTTYQERCSSCHMQNLQGNGDPPPLAGAGFASTWGDRQVRDLVAFIQATMPPGAGGSLGEPAYLNLTAFIL